MTTVFSRLILNPALFLLTLLPPASLLAQGPFQISVFDETGYQKPVSLEGPGIRFGVGRDLGVEGEYVHNVHHNFTDLLAIPPGTETIMAPSSLSADKILVGPIKRFSYSDDNVKLSALVTVKAGKDNYHLIRDASAEAVGTYDYLIKNGGAPALYLGAGGEVGTSRWGFRLDAGDELYFSSGTHNRFRLMFGPWIRF